jgi:hypothetical protein
VRKRMSCGKRGAYVSQLNRFNETNLSQSRGAEIRAVPQVRLTETILAKRFRERPNEAVLVYSRVEMKTVVEYARLASGSGA